MIYTTRGPIHKSELGVTLGHEHIKWESDEFHANNMYFDKKYQEEDIRLDLKYIMPIMLDNKAKGGKSVVEASSPIGGQNVRLLKELSERVDMHRLEFDETTIGCGFDAFGRETGKKTKIGIQSFIPKNVKSQQFNIFKYFKLAVS